MRLPALLFRCLLAVTVTAATTASAFADDPPPAGSVPPDRDPFYAAPADIASLRPGQIVASRKITPANEKQAAAADAWQISYRTSDSHDQPEMTVTTLLVPKRAWTGDGARPVVSLQAPEDSTGTQCAPSYGVSSGKGYAAVSASLASPALDRNWAVAMPDFQGPKSVFMAGPQAGHAVLDGIRAVRNFSTAGIGAANPWGLDGYSGGAQATGWAAELQPSYAPDVALAGVSMGGTPADPEAVARHLDGRVYAGFAVAAAVSLDVEFPEAGIRDLIDEEGREVLERTRGKCAPRILAAFPFANLSDYTRVPDPLSVPSVAAMLDRNTMGAAAPTAPIYNYHGDTDEIVPVDQADTLTKTWCAKGATIQIIRDRRATHAGAGLRRGGDALNFLADRFAGKPPTSDC